VSEEAENSPEFLALVREWLRQEMRTDAASVDWVSGGASTEEFGQDICGDVFDVAVRWTARDGEQRTLWTRPRETESLWHRVVELAVSPGGRSGG
jgi:hypothetical protein